MFKKKNTAIPEEVTDTENENEPEGEIVFPFSKEDMDSDAKPERKPVQRFSEDGHRRGKVRSAFWVGAVIIALAIIGLFALITFSVNAIKQASDKTELMTKLVNTAYPLLQYQPTAFAAPEEADQSTLLRAAILRLSEAERIRQLKEKTDECAYEKDDYGRMLISVEEVNSSFAALFGPDVTAKHQTLGESGGVAYTYEYDKENAIYHVPASEYTSLYQTLPLSISKKGKTAKVKIGYVLSSDIGVDDMGNPLEPNQTQIKYSQTFSFLQTGTEEWIITSVEDEQ